MADISKIKLPDGSEYNIKDEYLRETTGFFEKPYKEVEWVESTGIQFIYLDWKPPAGWGFEADFIIYNAFNTTQGGISATNRNGYGTLFGSRNSSSAARNYISTYSTNGYVVIGNSVYQTSGQLKKDGSRQTIKLHGTTYTKPDGTTMTVANNSAPTLNMSVFALTNGTVLPTSYANNDTLTQYGTARIYSLKFFNGDNSLAVDLVGAYRKNDGCTGLYDKVSKHFYPAAGMLKGNDIGDIGETITIERQALSTTPQMITTNTASTRLWTATINDFNELVDGQQFVLRNKYGSASEAQATELADKADSGASYNVYLKLTLADGSKTIWIPCYYGPTTRLTTHYGAGSEIRFVYRENVMVSTYSIVRGFFADANYVDGNDLNYNNREYYASRTTVTAMGRYMICGTKSDGSLVPMNNINNNVTKTKTLTTESFDPFGEFFFWNATSIAAAGENIGNQYLYRQILCDLRYSFNCGGYNATGEGTLTARNPLYLVVVPQNDGLVKLYSEPLSESLPNTDDGLLYIYLGRVYQDDYPYRVVLTFNHPIYWYKDGSVRQYTQYAANALKVNGHSVNKDVPSDAKFTDTVTTATTTGNGNAVTAVAASNGALTVTKGTTFLTQHQDISGKADKSTTVTNVAWDSTNKKLTKTINGTTTDVVTAATLRTGLNVADGAEVNQNAFSNVKVGSITVAADSKTDTLELTAGSNVTITPDATNDKVTIAATDTTYSAGDGLTLSSNQFSNHRGIEYIRGTWTAASGTWTGVSADSALYDGKQIILYMPFGGSGNATLNLTLAGGGTTGAKNVYFESTTRFTTHKGQNSQLHLIYHDSLVLSDGNTYSGWWYIANRDTNTNDSATGYTRFSHGTYKNTTAAGRYVICLTKSLTEVVPVTAVNNSTATTKTLTTEAFNPFEPIFYYTNNGSTTQTAANTALAVSYLWRNYSNIDLRYSFNTGTTLTNNKDVFIKASPTNGYMATLASTPIVQDLPTTDDGFIYIKLGHACSTSNIAMAYEHPIYWYKNGAVREYSNVGNASTSAYGVTKLSTSTSSTATDLAATPSAVKTAYDLANDANTTAGQALSGVNGTLIYDHTYSISNGVATFTAHVYQKGVEVTSSYADSCFEWSYKLANAVTGTPSVVSLGTGKTKTVTISTLGYGGYVLGTFTPPE